MNSVDQSNSVDQRAVHIKVPTVLLYELYDWILNKSSYERGKVVVHSKVVGARVKTEEGQTTLPIYRVGHSPRQLVSPSASWISQSRD